MLYLFLQYVIVLLVLNITGIITSLTGYNILGFIPCMFDLCDYLPVVYLPVSYLIVKYQIINKFKKLKMTNYKDIIYKLMVMCTIFNIVFYSLFKFLGNNDINILNLGIFCGSTIFFLYVVKPQSEKTKEEIDKYFNSHKN